MKLFEIVFWIGILVGWFTLVVYGIKWADSRLDKFLDRWFDPAGEGGRDCHSWPDYFDKN